MARKKQKILFPAGIFLLIFLTESILGSIALSAYTYVSLKKNINYVENYTRNYSKTMAEAFARVAELSLKTNKTDSLKTLFHEKIQQNTIDEAIFVLADGRLIVHSNTSVEKGLGGNIANDEMAYNLELILEPVKKNSHELFLSDYNIIDKKIPFSRYQRELIGRYIYPGINTTGWLFTRGVFVDNNPAGSVCFLTGKERIYSVIQEAFAQAVKYLYGIFGVSFCVSFIISLVILARYRSIQKRTERIARTRKFAGPVPQNETAPGDLTEPQEATPALTETENAGVMDDFDLFADEPADDTITGMETGIPAGTEEEGHSDSPGLEPITPQDKNDEGYITVEFLGEIQDEDQTEIQQQQEAGDYIARRIPAESLEQKGFKEIRDAVPARKGR